MEPITVTLNEIRKHRPCEPGWEKLLNHLGKTKADYEPLSLMTILASNGVEDAIWCLYALPNSEQWRMRLFAVACAEQVKHLMTDERSLNALDVARRYSLGLATDDELATARVAARQVSASASTAWAAEAAWETTADAGSARATAANARQASASRAQQRTLFIAYFGAPMPKEHYLEIYKQETS